MLIYQISYNSAQWKPSCSMRTDRRTDKCNEAKSGFSQFCERAEKQTRPSANLSTTNPKRSGPPQWRTSDKPHCHDKDAPLNSSSCKGLTERWQRGGCRLLCFSVSAEISLWFWLHRMCQLCCAVLCCAALCCAVPYEHFAFTEQIFSEQC